MKQTVAIAVSIIPKGKALLALDLANKLEFKLVANYNKGMYKEVLLFILGLKQGQRMHKEC